MSNRAPPHSSRSELICAQIFHARELLSQGKQSYAVKRILMDEWNISNTVALKRIQAAKTQIIEEIKTTDRQDLAAILISAAHRVLDKSFETKQLSNAIGAINMLGKLTGILTKDN